MDTARQELHNSKGGELKIRRELRESRVRAATQMEAVRHMLDSRRNIHQTALDRHPYLESDVSHDDDDDGSNGSVTCI